MTVRNTTTLKGQLTDATIVNQSDSILLDTAGDETVARHKTVRSLRHALRRLVKDAGDEKLYVNTLAGAQVRAMMTEAATTPVAGSEYVAAILAVVTGDTSDYGDFAPDSDVPSHDWKNLLSACTVLYSDGKYYIDDVGMTTWYRPPVATSEKHALRRVISEVGTSNVYYLNTVSGLIINALAALDSATASLTDIKTSLESWDAVTTTSATTKAAVTGPNASIRQLFGSTLRQRVSGVNRAVYVDDVGHASSTKVTKPRISMRKTIYDLMSTDGATIYTYSGLALAALAALSTPTAEDLINAIEAVVEV